MSRCGPHGERSPWGPHRDITGYAPLSHRHSWLICGAVVGPRILVAVKPGEDYCLRNGHSAEWDRRSVLSNTRVDSARTYLSRKGALDLGPRQLLPTGSGANAQHSVSLGNLPLTCAEIPPLPMGYLDLGSLLSLLFVLSAYPVPMIRGTSLRVSGMPLTL
jgi:hypothetical protein